MTTTPTVSSSMKPPGCQSVAICRRLLLNSIDMSMCHTVMWFPCQKRSTGSAWTRTELCALHQASDFFGARYTSGVLKQGKERRKRSLVKRERNIVHESSDKHVDPPAERDGL